MHETKKRYKVYSPVKNNDEKTFWVKMGIGYQNQDGSTNIYLDGLPVNGKLQLREWDEPSRVEGSRELPEPANENPPF